ncbi:SIR2 family protein [Paenibacillus segetis]|uniref:SIR2-like domain-containing protein n=1 Tax=Paenibacillus segetis TaxID=1325360 RepID=A0ABQ1YY77_9BACL|nr:SIR2 family protein [Paenibacillus segetis]GGH40785.1 hypothetical protein GCM10008013_50460 [Paenibacillus segetis]
MTIISPAILTLDDAINQIKQVSDEHINIGKMSPYFFLVGAGISYPSAPLAKDIIEHCKESALRHGREIGSQQSTSSTQEEYSVWFELAYPNRQQRQNYLKKLIHNRIIPPANIKLAHILSNSTITNLVVTTNFDDFLSRSLNIFGIPHIVSDHPHTVEKINTESEYAQIVHIHGTYWFYDCCNLQSEIVQRAERSLQSNSTMSFFIDSLLYRRIPIIIGYSGWENDVFMQALKRRLESPLPYNLYWFCYSKDSFEAIPEWIKVNSDVKFVLPLESNTIDRYGNIDSRDLIEGLNVINVVEDNPKVNVLNAEVVFEHFINVFNMESPEITRDPIGFFTESLRKSFENNNSENGNNKYFLEDVIARLERVKGSKEYNTNTFIEELKELIKKSQYKEVVKKIAEDYRFSSFSLDEYRQLLSVVLNAANNITENEEGYEIVISISNKLYSTNYDLVWIKETLCRGLLGKGKNLSARELYNEAIEVFNQVIEDEKFDEYKNLKAEALLNKAYAYGSLEERNEEIKIYNLILNTYGDEAEIKIKRIVAICILSKASLYHDINENEEALGSAKYLIGRCIDETDLHIQNSVARAMLIKVLIFFEQEMYDESITELEQLLIKYSQEEDKNLKKTIAISLEVKGIMLRRLDRPNEALGVYDELAYRFKDELSLKEYAASAMIDKANYFDEIGYHEKAIELYEDIIVDYGEIDEFSEKAIISKANSFVSMGKFEEAIALYNNIIEENSKINVANLDYVANAFVRKGMAYARNNQFEHAVDTYSQLCHSVKKRKDQRSKEIWAASMLSMAASYKSLNNHVKMVSCYDEVIVRLKSNKELTIKKYVASAMFDKAVLFGKENRNEDAIKLFNQLYLRLRNEEDINLKVRAVLALLNKGSGYKLTKSFKKAYNTFELLENRFNNSEDKEIKIYTYSAIIEKVSVMLSLNQDPIEAFSNIKLIESNIKQIPDNDLLLKRYVMELNNIGYTAYGTKKDYDLASRAFLSSFNMNNVISGVNLVYMIRRGEISAEGLPTIEKLLEGGLGISNPFAIINKILIDLDCSNCEETWKNCDQLINSIDEVDSIIEWWYDVAKNNEAEGHLVVGWLCKNKKAIDPEGLSFHERFDLAKKLGIEIPNWLVSAK